MFFKSKKTKKERYYFDYAAATPMDPEVIRVVHDVNLSQYANPGALHQDAVGAKALLEESRECIADFFSAHKSEIVFTSGGTESDVLAIRGVIEHARKENPKTVPHVVMSEIEHVAVKEVLDEMYDAKKIGLSILPVDENGLVQIDDLKKLVTEDTVLVSVMYVNNEIGVVQDMPAIAKEVRRLRKKLHGDRSFNYPLLHTDASQAVLSEDIRVTKLGVDLLSCNAGKIYGPKGIGLLFVRRGVELSPLFYAGGQESGLRPGTEPLSLVAGFAKAVELIGGDAREKRIQTMADLRRFFIESLHERAVDPVLKGLNFEYKINGGSQATPHIVSVSVEGLEADQIVIEMDARGVSISAKSACKTTDPQISHVLKAIGYEDTSWGTVRFSFGKETTHEDVLFALDSFKEVCIKLLHTKKEFNL
jgi:cysteine desulfurase